MLLFGPQYRYLMAQCLCFGAELGSLHYLPQRETDKQGDERKQYVVYRVYMDSSDYFCFDDVHSPFVLRYVSSAFVFA